MDRSATRESDAEKSPIPRVPSTKKGPQEVSRKLTQGLHPIAAAGSASLPRAGRTQSAFGSSRPDCLPPFHLVAIEVLWQQQTGTVGYSFQARPMAQVSKPDAAEPKFAAFFDLDARGRCRHSAALDAGERKRYAQANIATVAVVTNSFLIPIPPLPSRSTRFVGVGSRTNWERIA